MSVSNELVYLQRKITEILIWRGRKVPSFYTNNMDLSKVQTLIEEAITANETLFLIEWNVAADNHIKVVVDGDTGVPLSECIRISRHVEHNLDRDSEDFSLEVTTPNVTDELVNKRQYNKNLGRILKVKTNSEKLEGKLTEIGENGITLQWKAREPKPIGKGKITVEKTQTVLFDDIEQVKVKLIF